MDADAAQDLVRRRLLGVGLASTPIDPGLDIGRDLSLVDGPGGVDLATVEGIGNLTQGLEIALTTALGSDVFNTEFGFDGVLALVEETEPVLVRERVRVSIIRLLGGDPRVGRIIDLKLIDGRLAAGTSGSAGDTGSAVDRWRTVDVQVAFETVTGDAASVNLRSVVPYA